MNVARSAIGLKIVFSLCLEQQSDCCSVVAMEPIEDSHWCRGHKIDLADDFAVKMQDIAFNDQIM